MSLLETLLRAAFTWLVYPGFLFLTGIGLLAESLRRQFAFRAEGRLAPPLLQPLSEILKLLDRAAVVTAAKELAEDDQASRELEAARQEAVRLGLYAIPILGLIGLTSGIVLLPLPGNLWPFLTDNAQPGALGADLPALALLLMTPAVGVIILGSVTGSVYAQLAGSRIFQLLVACAVPYAVAVFGPAVVEGSLDLRSVVNDNGQAMLAAKALCGLLFLVCMPVLMRLRPFMVSRGEGLEGVRTDLTGPPLGLLRLLEATERLAFAVFFTALYVPLAASNPLIFLAGLLFALGFTGLIETLLSQVRLRDALSFYLRYTNPAALVLLVLVAFAIKI